MNDYISRADAIQAINYEADKLEQNGAIPHGQGARAMAVVIEALPAADVEDVDRYEQGRIEGRVQMRTELLKALKRIVGEEVWRNI